LLAYLFFLKDMDRFLRKAVLRRPVDQRAEEQHIVAVVEPDPLRERRLRAAADFVVATPQPMHRALKEREADDGGEDGALLQELSSARSMVASGTPSSRHSVQT
jgi:hypothetical protein